MEEDIESFTDVFDDEFPPASQPMSLSMSPPPQPAQPNTQLPTPQVRTVRGFGQYGQFRSVEEIDPKYRSVFSYPYFNLIQSTIIDDAMYTDKSIVVCAPTGSGKTVVFEMAIVQLLMDLHEQNYTGDFKIVYMAPVKALCTERLSEWYPKFTKLGHLCIEVTGDTDVDFSQLKPYKIIITTPEKWDMLTRRWTEFRSLVQVIRLFLIDEVHILNDECRGPVLEAVVSRMKTIEESMKAAHRVEQVQLNIQAGVGSGACSPPPRIRFIAVSATVSNPEDVATWLGTKDKPAVYYKLGEECRPVKLKRVVEGYHCPEGTSIFKFDIQLSYKLWPIIQKYYDGKPTLIFCSTRKSVMMTAETLSREITIQFAGEQRGKLAALAATIKDKKLQALVSNGVGCHHAGLLYEERQIMEHAFRQRDLPILVTTTTLAMGVNLPAHLVIIKSTQQYVNGQYQEYSISTVLQMIGRAGRPQFDTEATAVVMTRHQDKSRYSTLVDGSGPLESSLHRRLAEHLNSEVALRTVQDVAQGVQWARSTFLHVRAARDPRRYLSLAPTAPPEHISQKMQDLCMKAMNGLASAGLVTMDEACCVSSTDAGRMMSIYCLDFETMKLIMKISGEESLQQLLALVCESHELAGLQLRAGERRTLNALNRSSAPAATATVRFPLKGKISTRQMKFNCVIQAVFGCLQIPDPSLHQESVKLVRTADRICKCMAVYLTREEFIKQQPPYLEAIVNAVTLAKCCAARLWEDSPYASRQLRGIGPALSTLLASAGKSNFMLIEESHPRDLERVMNKNPPAGNVLRKQVGLLPKYQLATEQLDYANVLVRLSLLNAAHMAEHMDELTAGDNHRSYILAGDSENCILLCALFKDRDLILGSNASITYSFKRKHEFEHTIHICCISSTFVGLDVKASIKLSGTLPLVHLNLENKYCDEQSTRNTKNMFIPLSKCNNNSPVIKTKQRKQSTITSAYKEHKKRINCNDNSKEIPLKRKKDCSMLEKFKSLKDSFGIDSDALKTRLQKTGKLFQNVSVGTSGPSHYNMEPHVQSSDDIDHEIYDNNITEDMFQNPENLSPSKSDRGTEMFVENLSTEQLDEMIDKIPDVNGNNPAQLTLYVDNLLEDIEKEMEAAQDSKETKLSQNIFSKIERTKDHTIIDKLTLNVAERYSEKVVKSKKDTKSFKQCLNNDPYMRFSLLHLSNEDELSDDSGTAKNDGFNDHIRLNLHNFLEKESYKAENIDMTILPMDLFQNEQNTPKYPLHPDFAERNSQLQKNKMMLMNDDLTRNLEKHHIHCDQNRIGLNGSIHENTDPSTIGSIWNKFNSKFDILETLQSDPNLEKIKVNQIDNRQSECKQNSNNAMRHDDVEWVKTNPESLNHIEKRKKTDETLPKTELINNKQSEQLHNSSHYEPEERSEVKTDDNNSIVERKNCGIPRIYNFAVNLKDKSQLINRDLKNTVLTSNHIFMEEILNRSAKSQNKIEIIENVSIEHKTTITENSDITKKGILEVGIKTKCFRKSGYVSSTGYEFKTTRSILKKTNPKWDDFQNQPCFNHKKSPYVFNTQKTENKVLQQKFRNDLKANVQSVNKYKTNSSHFDYQKPKQTCKLTLNKKSKPTETTCKNIYTSGNSLAAGEVEGERGVLDVQTEGRIERNSPRTVQSVLQKYYCSFRRGNDTYTNPTVNFSVLKERKTKPKGTRSQNQYRIQEMDNIDMNIPFFTNLTDNNPVQSVDETISFLNSDNTAIHNEIVLTSEICSNVEIQSEPDSQDGIAFASQDNQVSISPTMDESCSHLDQRMFDPKLLIASYKNNSSRHLVPPPTEFCNKQGDRDNLIGTATSHSYTSEFVYSLETQMDDVIAVPPEGTNAKGIEIWTLSRKDHEEECGNLLTKTFQSFPTMRNSSSKDLSQSDKLGKFKFTDREKLKLHKKYFFPPYYTRQALQGPETSKDLMK